MPVSQEKIANLLSKSRAGRAAVKSLLETTEGSIKAELERVRGLKSTCEDSVARFETARDSADELIAQAAIVRELFEKIAGFTEQVDEHAEKLEDWNEEILEKLDQADELIEGALESGIEEVDGKIEEQFEAIDNFTSDTVDRLSNQATGLVERIEENRDSAVEKTKELLSADLTAMIGGETEELFEQIDSLKGKGISEIEKISEMLEQITEKTEALTDLIETVKPILDYARQVL